MSLNANTTSVTSTVGDVAPKLPPVVQHPRHEAAPDAKRREQHKRVSEEETQKIVRDINSALQAVHTELSFTIDKETNKTVLKVINSRTQEVVRQIPAEDALRLASRISKLMGILVDENA